MMKMTIDSILFVLAYIFIVWGGMTLADSIGRYMVVQ